MRSPPPALSRRTGESRCPFRPWVPAFAGMTLVAGSLAVPAAAGEALKPGGTLTYVIAADAPPSFDAHREATFATVYSAAPFYSVLIRVDPKNPSSNNFVCDLCTESGSAHFDDRNHFPGVLRLRPNRISPVVSKNSGSSKGLKRPSRPTRIPRSAHRNVAR